MPTRAGGARGWGMYFTIKIVRFVVRLVLKVLLFPFRLVGRLLGQDTDDDYGGDFTAEPTATSETPSTSSTPTAQESDADARKRIRWFQKGLYAYGGIQLILGLIMLIDDVLDHLDVAFDASGAPSAG